MQPAWRSPWITGQLGQKFKLNGIDMGGICFLVSLLLLGGWVFFWGICLLFFNYLLCSFVCLLWNTDLFQFRASPIKALSEVCACNLFTATLMPRQSAVATAALHLQSYGDHATQLTLCTYLSALAATREASFSLITPSSRLTSTCAPVPT